MHFNRVIKNTDTRQKNRACGQQRRRSLFFQWGHWDGLAWGFRRGALTFDVDKPPPPPPRKKDNFGAEQADKQKEKIITSVGSGEGRTTI